MDCIVVVVYDVGVWGYIVGDNLIVFFVGLFFLGVFYYVFCFCGKFDDKFWMFFFYVVDGF